MARVPLNNVHILLPSVDGRLGIEHYVMRHFILSNTLTYNQNIHMRYTYLFADS